MNERKNEMLDRADIDRNFYCIFPNITLREGKKIYVQLYNGFLWECTLRRRKNERERERETSME